MPFLNRVTIFKFTLRSGNTTTLNWWFDDGDFDFGSFVINYGDNYKMVVSLGLPSVGLLRGVSGGAWCVMRFYFASLLFLMLDGRRRQGGFWLVRCYFLASRLRLSSSVSCDTYRSIGKGTHKMFWDSVCQQIWRYGSKAENLTKRVLHSKPLYLGDLPSEQAIQNYVRSSWCLDVYSAIRLALV